MLKGINRRVVIMKNTGSELFDEAYFLIKENAVKGSKAPVSEAKKLLRRIEGNKKKKSSLAPIFVFLAGCAVGIIVGILFFSI